MKNKTFGLQKLDNEIRVTIDEAVKKAKTDNEIGLNELTCDIYSAPLEVTVRGITPWNNLENKRLGPAINLH
jgi:hypothetical protein